MAKKYLLYIHDDNLFDSEPNKSELVNTLLVEYWRGKSSKFKIEEIKTPTIIKTKFDCMRKGCEFAH